MGFDEIRTSSFAGKIVLFGRGGDCFFDDKFNFLQSRGALAGIAVNSEDNLFTMDVRDPHGPKIGIFGMLITRSSGNELRSAIGDGLRVSINLYNRPIWDVSGLFLMVLAFSGAWLGAWWATLKLRKDYQRMLWRTLSLAGIGSPGQRPRDHSEGEETPDVVILTTTVALAFICAASFGLVLMFYFVSFLIWVIDLLFAFGGASSLTVCLSAFLKAFIVSRRTAEKQVDLSWVPFIHWILAPANRARSPSQLSPDEVERKTPSPRHQPMGSSDHPDIEAVLESHPEVDRFSSHHVSKVTLCIIPFTLGWAIWWLVVRSSVNYSWVLQNTLGFALLLELQRLVRIPSLKVATILLVLAFVYDVFWVFISPYIFDRSVMYVSMFIMSPCLKPLLSQLDSLRLLPSDMPLRPG